MDLAAMLRTVHPQSGSISLGGAFNKQRVLHCLVYAGWCWIFTDEITASSMDQRAQCPLPLSGQPPRCINIGSQDPVGAGLSRAGSEACRGWQGLHKASEC